MTSREAIACTVAIGTPALEGWEVEPSVAGTGRRALRRTLDDTSNNNSAVWRSRVDEMITMHQDQYPGITVVNLGLEVKTGNACEDRT